MFTAGKTPRNIQHGIIVGIVNKYDKFILIILQGMLQTNKDMEYNQIKTIVPFIVLLMHGNTNCTKLIGVTCMFGSFPAGNGH